MSGPNRHQRMEARQGQVLRGKGELAIYFVEWTGGGGTEYMGFEVGGDG